MLGENPVHWFWRLSLAPPFFLLPFVALSLMLFFRCRGAHPVNTHHRAKMVVLSSTPDSWPSLVCSDLDVIPSIMSTLPGGLSKALMLWQSTLGNWLMNVFVHGTFADYIKLHMPIACTRCSLPSDLLKGLKFPQMGIFGMRNFWKKTHTLNLRLITTILNQMKCHLYVVNLVEKLLHSQKAFTN